MRCPDRQRGEREVVISSGVVERVDRWQTAGDRDAVLGAGALVDAARLVLPTAAAEPPPLVVLELTWLHWSRYQALPEPDDRAELEICLALAGAVVADAPERLPAPVREWYATTGTARLVDSVSGYYAAVLCEVALAARDVDLVDHAVQVARAGGVDRVEHANNVALLLWERFTLAADPADLDQIIDVAEATLRGGGDHPLHRQIHLNLGRAHTSRAELSDDPRPGLATALPHLRAALASVAPGAVERADYLCALAYALLAGVTLGSTDADLDECERSAREALDAAPDEVTVLRSTLILCDLLHWRSVLHDDMADTDEAIRLARAALPVVEHDPHAAELVRGALAIALTSRASRSGGDRADADLLAEIRELGVEEDLWDDVAADEWRVLVRTRAEAVRRAREVPRDTVRLGVALYELAVASGDLEPLTEAARVLRSAAAGDDPSAAREHLARVCVTAYEVDESDARLDDAIAAVRAAVPVLHDDQIRLQFLWRLGLLLGQRFTRTAKPGDVDEQVAVLRAAVPLAGAPGPRAMALSGLAEALRAKAIETQTADSVNDCVEAAVQAVEATPPGDEFLAPRQGIAGRALSDRFGISADPADAARATRMLRAAASGVPEGHPHRHAVLVDLATALFDESQAAGTGAPDESIELCRAVLSAGADGDWRAALVLADVLVHRFGRSGVERDLDDAVTALRAAAALFGADERVAVVAKTVRVLARYESLDRVTEAVDLGQSTVDLVLPEHRRRPELAAAIAFALAKRHDLTGDRADLDSAIDQARWAVDRCPPHLPSRTKHIRLLTMLLRSRSTATGDLSDVDEIITVARSATVAPGHPVAAALGSALAARTPSRADAYLAEAIDLLTAGVERVPAGHPDRYALVLDLASALSRGVLETGDLDRLTRGVGVVTRAFGELPAVDGTALAVLGSLLFTWYQRTSDLGGLSDGLTALRAATGHDLPEAAGALVRATLASALLARHQRLGDSADLTEAVTHARSAVHTAREPDSLAILANCLTTTSQRHGDPDSLEEAMRCARLALVLPAKVPMARSTHLESLAMALMVRFTRTASRHDLNEAVETFRAAAAVIPDGFVARSALVMALSSALTVRADLHGASADVDEAIATARLAVESAATGTVQRRSALENLSNALLFRRDRARPGEIAEAVDVAERGLAECPVDHPDRFRHLANLARATRARAEHHTGTGVVDFDRAIALHHETAGAMGDDHPLAPVFWLDLANALQGRYARSGDDQDAVAAASWAARAAEALPPESPDSAAAYLLLGNVLRIRSRRHGTARDFATAVDALRSAAETRSGTVAIRLAAAWSWAMLAADREDWDTALEGFTTAVALLSRVVSPGVDHRGGERRLTRWDGLVAGAAAVALWAGDPGRAVELLEQGRSVLWSRELRTRDEFTDLRDRDPGLHSRLREVATALAMAEADPATPVPGIPNVADGRIRLAEEWDRLVAEARALPGMAGFLHTPSLAEIRAGLPAGPVVLITLDATRCDALIVSRDHDVDHVPLPDLTRSEAKAQTRAYLAALESRSPGAVQTVHATLEWLWDRVAEPVLARLGADGNGPLPRVWWCPTGPLAMLPLHAAGYHDPDDTPAGRTVLDRVVSSYTPTLRALARAVSAPSHVDDPRLLVVSMPESPPGVPTLSPLPGARAEAEFLTRTLPHTYRTAATATRSAVLADLRTHPHAHFACHGGHNPEHPSTAALYLHDGPLTVLDIAAQDLTHAQLAYLSACHTATAATTLPDESIHLAAALQLAGYRHVVATLWTIPDTTATHLATTVYSALTTNNTLDLTDTARTLHHATRTLRDATPLDPAHWVPFIHIGP
ncbi:CHAT domain-containing protein [Actinokineospora cianjurensis]|uniref:CHAT domain-containing protein n=1 Tax=Actinokineospora cianjurensis TaxID=585224 RepID=A0A421B2V3_9PSEU|nr:CHAT domain-containing protein [Actinokineospora cianjurensis]RLK58707.1 CHAT domain-containing protein [Actinokineospora cianjurensis]